MNINVLLVFRDLVCSKKRYQSDNKKMFWDNFSLISCYFNLYYKVVQYDITRKTKIIF